MSLRIFLSYGHDEHAILAQKLKFNLEERGHQVWFDLDRLTPGDDWENYIEEGLNWVSELPAQGRMVLLMTPHSVRRPGGYCLNEIAAAILRDLPIIPIMVVWCEPPLSIIRIQWMDMQDCVPVDTHKERYELKLERLIEALELGRMDFEASQARLLKDLNPLDFKADLAKHVPHFTGREWLFVEIRAWLADPQASRIFWITGNPGVGKTAIAAYLCHQWEVVAFHFCTYADDLRANSTRCVLSLAFQLASQLPEYQDQLMRRLGDLDHSAKTLFNHLIAQPLTRLKTISRPYYLIVIDALDEATKDGRNELAEFLADQFDLTPSWLRLIITSRPDPEVTVPLQKYKPYILDAGRQENIEDIRSYIRRQLTTLFPKQPPSERLIETILSKSEGVFLYTTWIINELKEGRLTMEQVEQFPQGLGGVYLSFFQRQFPDITVFKNRHRPFLEMIIAARGPLPLSLANFALKWGPYEYQLNDQGEASGEALAPLGSLFPHASDHIRPFHRSLVDWLTYSVRAGDYFVDLKQGQARLAEVCWAEYQAGVEKLSPYSLAHLPTHLMETERWNDLLELITSPELRLITRWVEAGEGDKGLGILTGLINYLEKYNRQPALTAGLATQAARIYSLWGEYDQAHTWLELARSHTSWWRGRREAAITIHELGSLALYQGDFDQAIGLYRQALRLCLWGWPRYHDEAAANLIGLATVAHADYRLDETLRLASQALNEARRAKDLRHIVAAERLWGVGLKSLGRFAEADLHFRLALALCEEGKVQLEKARLLMLQGWLAFDQATLEKRVPQESQEYFTEALMEAKKVHNFYVEMEARMSLGWCALAEMLTSEAARWLDPLPDLLPTGRHPDLRGGIFLGLAAIQHQQGKLDAAERCYQEAMSFCRQHKLKAWQYKALVGVGAVSRHLGRFEEAETIWEQALQVAAEIAAVKHTLAQASIDLCRANPFVTPR